MASLDRYGRSTYSPTQIQAFFERISLPERYRDHEVLHSPATARTVEGLEFLAILQKYTLAAVPFECLALHYSPHHTIVLDPQALFQKVVGNGNGRGGYCMENSTLFGTLLRSLGYDVYPTAARVNEAVQGVAQSKNWAGPKFDGWNHMINIVNIMGQKYVVDVGFGSSGPHYPVPLTENYSARNVGTQSLRIIREAPPDLLTTSNPAFKSTDQHMWIYQYRHNDEEAWLPAYCFSEMEFTPNDFTILNHFTSTSRTSWFTYTVLCVKMVMEEGKLVGDVTLMGNEVKKRIGGVSKTLAVFESEGQRIEALKEYLGIKLTEDEKNGIRGMVTEIY